LKSTETIKDERPDLSYSHFSNFGSLKSTETDTRHQTARAR